jgi:hypothetical protein
MHRAKVECCGPPGATGKEERHDWHQHAVNKGAHNAFALPPIMTAIAGPMTPYCFRQALNSRFMRLTRKRFGANDTGTEQLRPAATPLPSVSSNAA